MSGICGIYFFDERPVEGHALKNMLDAISYRGPDNSNIWYEGSIGLGNCLLCTTPESINEKLPLISRDGNLILIADARIDNRDELLSMLNIHNQSISDSEIILSAYEQWQEDCPKKLIGDYAFAVWDKRTQRLFCVRDALGVRPFFYYRGDDFFAFASDSQAIFTLPQVKKQINKTALLDFLLKDFDSENTEFENLHCLKPAHTIIINKNSLKENCYWDVDSNKAFDLKRKEEYKELFLDVFTKIITAQLRINGKAGILLSGGIDSSSILCLIEDLKTQKKVQTEISAYSATYPGEVFDEKERMLSLQSKWGTSINFLEPKIPEEPWKLQNRTWTNSQPFWDNTYILEELITKAKQNQTKVLFAGHGGDEFLDLSLSLATDLFLAFHPFRAFRYIKKYLRFQDISSRYAFNYILPELVSGVMPEAIKKQRAFLHVNRKYPWLTKYYKKIAVEKLRKRSLSLKQLHFKSIACRSFYSILHNPLITRTIQDFERVILRTGSIEMRMPFFDRRLIEFVFSIPPEEIVPNEEPKGLIRGAMGSRIPDKISKYSWKTSLTSHLNKQLIKNNSEEILELLSSSRLEQLGLINGTVVQSEFKSTYKIYTNHEDKTKHSLSNLYPLLYLEDWLRRVYKEGKTN